MEAFLKMPRSFKSQTSRVRFLVACTDDYCKAFFLSVLAWSSGLMRRGENLAWTQERDPHTHRKSLSSSSMQPFNDTRTLNFRIQWFAFSITAICNCLSNKTTVRSRNMPVTLLECRFVFPKSKLNLFDRTVTL